LSLLATTIHNRDMRWLAMGQGMMASST